MSFFIMNNLFMIISIIVYIVLKYNLILRVIVIFIGGWDGILGMMIVVFIVVVFIIVMYSIYVVMEVVRLKCFVFFVIILEFVVGI